VSESESERERERERERAVRSPKDKAVVIRKPKWAILSICLLRLDVLFSSFCEGFWVVSKKYCGFMLEWILDTWVEK